MQPKSNDLVAAFAARCEQDMQAMQAAAGSGDFGTVDRLAHRMVGAAGALEFDGIADVARAVSSCARSGHAHILPGLVQHLGRIVVANLHP